MKIGLIGLGKIGQSLAGEFLSQGCEVLVIESNTDPGFLEKARTNMVNGLWFMQGADGKPMFRTILEIREAMRHIEILPPSPENWKRLAECTAVFEAAVERRDVKKDIYASAGIAALEAAFFATTSTLTARLLSNYIVNPERFMNYHPFSTPGFSLMPVVELIPHAGTSKGTVAFAASLAEKFGKRVFTLADVPGFFVNRVLLAMFQIDVGADYTLLDRMFGNKTWSGSDLARQIVLEGYDTAREFVEVLQQGFAYKITESEADELYRLATNSAKGPFGLQKALYNGTAGDVKINPIGKTGDSVGIDVIRHCFASLNEQEPGGWKTPAVIEKLFAEKNFGMKTGKGFYDHDGNITVERRFCQAVPSVEYAKISWTGKYVPVEIIKKLRATILELGKVPGLAAIVVEVSYVRGADVREFPAGLFDNEVVFKMITEWHALDEAIKKCLVPVATIAYGPNKGGGAELVWMGDRVYAKEGATFELPEVHGAAVKRGKRIPLGILPGGCGTQNFARRAGLVNTIRVVCGGETVLVRPPYVDEVMETIDWARIEADIVSGIPKRVRAPLPISDGEWADIQQAFKEAYASYDGEEPPESMHLAFDAIIHGNQLPFEVGASIELDAICKAFMTPDAERGVDAVTRKGMEA